MIIRTSKRTRFVIFLVLVVAALAVVVTQWPSGPSAPSSGAAATPTAAAPVTAPAAAPVATTAAPTAADYFVTARLEQQQAESRELALDQQVAADSAAATSVRADAESRIVALGRQQDQEAEIRALLLAKGYKDAVVYLSSQPASAVVVLDAGTLTSADVARAADAVERVAGVPAGDISVMAHS